MCDVTTRYIRRMTLTALLYTGDNIQMNLSVLALTGRTISLIDPEYQIHIYPPTRSLYGRRFLSVPLGNVVAWVDYSVVERYPLHIGPNKACVPYVGPYYKACNTQRTLHFHLHHRNTYGRICTSTFKTIHFKQLRYRIQI